MRIERDDMKNFSVKALQKEAQRMRDKLEKRRKSLRAAVDAEPGKYNSSGLKELEGYDEGRKKSTGIPKTSTSMGRQAISVALTRLYDLDEMKTTSKTGARQAQRDAVKRIANIDVNKTRMNKDEKARFDDFTTYFNDKPEKISEFWELYGVFKEKMELTYKDYNQMLKDFSEQFSEDIMGGVMTPAQLEIRMDQQKKLFLDEQADEDAFMYANEPEIGSGWGDEEDDD